jgi:hypothetical protein
MNTKITMQDLIDTLRKAAASPEGHEPAQKRFFSSLKENSVLVDSGVACCVAGYLRLKAHEGAPEKEITEIISQARFPGTPSTWVAKELGLSCVERALAFDANSHNEVHSLLADLLEQGLRLPDVDYVNLSSESTYTKFEWARLQSQSNYMDLKDLKGWMREIAE